MDGMRVAMVIIEYHPIIGGAQRQLAHAARELANRGIDVQVVTRQFAGLAPFEMVDGIPVHRLPAPGPKAAASAIFTLGALLKLQHLKPQVIHAYSLFSPASIAVTAKRLWGTPNAVKVLRGGILGDIARLERKPLAKRRIAAYRRHLDAFVTISSEIDAELDALGIPASKRPFIPNGVDTQTYAPVSEAEKTGLRQRLNLHHGPLVVYTGRLEAEKQIHMLLDAWEALEGSPSGAELLVLGSGSQERQLRSRQVAGVRWLGRVENVAPYLQASDLFVLPSYTEGLSNALLEAMSSGLACIATRVGGAPDVIRHAHDGWLVPADQPETLREAISTLLGDERLRDSLGQAARDRILADYALPVVAGRLSALYQALYTRDATRLPRPIAHGEQA